MKTVKDFRNYDFESWNVPSDCEGDYAPATFFKKHFIPIARKEFKALAKRIGAEIEFSPNYFDYSAFFSKNGKFVYVHVGDVRFESRWYEHILYRTAKSNKDYTGGSNRYCSYEELEEELSYLLEN